MTIEEMEANGTFGTWSELNGFINQFIERNHPLTTEDFTAIVQDKTTPNLINRQLAHDAMIARRDEIVNNLAEQNTAWLKDIQNNPSSIGNISSQTSIAQQTQRMAVFKDQLLEARWNALEAYQSQQSQTENEASTTQETSYQDNTQETTQLDNQQEANQPYQEPEQEPPQPETSQPDASGQGTSPTEAEQPEPDHDNSPHNQEQTQLQEQEQDIPSQQPESEQNNEQTQQDESVAPTPLDSNPQSSQDMIDQVVQQGLEMNIGVQEMNECVQQTATMAQLGPMQIDTTMGI